MISVGAVSESRSVDGYRDEFGSDLNYAEFVSIGRSKREEKDA